jgi:hypothetical protein
MKKLFIAAVAAMLLVNVVPGSKLQAQKPGSAVPLKGTALLKKYGNCQKVKPEENKIGLSIKSISKKDGNKFLIEWNSDVVKKSKLNSIIVPVFMYIIDANDFSNYKNGLSASFIGNIGSHEKMIMELDKPAESVFIYYRGIDTSVAKSEPYRTPPLFFMADLGDSPRLLDKTPRHAGQLFKEIDEKEKAEKEKTKKEKAKNEERDKLRPKPTTSRFNSLQKTEPDKPTLSEGETLYVGTANIPDIEDFQIRFVLSADKKQIRDLTLTAKDFKYSIQRGNSTHNGSVGSSKISFTYPFDLNSLSTDLNLGSSGSITGLKFTDGGANAIVEYVHQATISRMGDGNEKVPVQFPSANVIFKSKQNN